MRKSSAPKKAHRGFHEVAMDIASKQNLPIEAANAIVASSARKASKQARKANPRLNKVSGMPPMSKAPSKPKPKTKSKPKKMGM
jgi:hypothetical protein